MEALLLWVHNRCELLTHASSPNIKKQKTGAQDGGDTGIHARFSSRALDRPSSRLRIRISWDTVQHA